MMAGSPYFGYLYDDSQTKCLSSSSFCYRHSESGQVAFYDAGAQVGSVSDPFSSLPSTATVFSLELFRASESICIATAYATEGTYPTEITFEVMSAYDGTSWSDLTTGSDFGAVCPSTDECFVNSDGSFTSYDGSSWSTPINPFASDSYSSDSLYDLSCLSDSFCVGTSIDEETSFFDGTSWSDPIEAGTVTCISATFCYGTSSGSIATYDGSSWSSATNPFASDGASSDSIDEVSSASSSLCYASSEAGYASIFDGSTWSTATNPYASAGDLFSLTSATTAHCSSNGGALTPTAPYGRAVSALEADDPSRAGCGCTGIQPKAGEPVNTATGDFETNSVDLSEPGSGVPLGFVASYSSLLAQSQVANDLPSGSLGYGWSDDLEMSISVDTDTSAATVSEENGAQITFDPYSVQTSPWWCNGATNYCATAPRSIATLNHNTDGTWTFVRSLSGATTFTFDATGVLVSEADAAGDSISSSAGTPGSGECPSSAASCTVWTSSITGRAITLVYNSDDELSSVVDQGGNSTTFCDFDQSCAPSSGGQEGDLASITQYSGTSVARTTAYSYDSSNSNTDLQHDMLTAVPPGGGSTDETSNTYGSGGRVTAQILPGGSAYTFAYSGSSYADDNGSPIGGTTTVVYYADGTGSGEPSTTDVYTYANGVEQSEAVDTTGTDRTKSYLRDPTTLLATTATDLDGNTTETQVSGANDGDELPSANVLTSTDGDGNTSAFAYTSLNLPWCEVDPADYANGTRCPSTEPSSPPAPGTQLGYTLTLYDSSGIRVASTTDPLGNTSTYGYTSGVSGVPDGLQYCTIDPVQYAAEYAADSSTAGQCPTYGTTQAGVTTKTFDSSGDVLSSTDPDGNTTSYTYGSAASPGLPTVTTDPDGTVTTDTYNAEGEILTQVVTGTTGSYSATTAYAYDSSGRQWCEVGPYDYSLGITLSDSKPTSPPTGTPGYTDTIYNSNGQVTSTTNPIGGTTQYAYDSAGNKYCTVSPDNYASAIRCPTSLPLTTPTVGDDSYVGATIDTYNAQNQVVQVTNPLGGITSVVTTPQAT